MNGLSRFKYYMGHASSVSLLIVSFFLLTGFLEADAGRATFETQKVYYSVNVEPTSIQLTLVSRTELPVVREEILKNREGFILHLSHKVKLELRSLAQSQPLIVIPTIDGGSIMVLTSGIREVNPVDMTKTSLTFSIKVNPEALAESRRDGNGETKGTSEESASGGRSRPEHSMPGDVAAADGSAHSTGSIEDRAVLASSAAAVVPRGNEYVTLRGRVVDSSRLGQLMRLPEVVPQFPLSTYVDAAINPPGADVVYLPGTTLTGGSADRDIFLGYKVGPGSFRPFVQFMYEHDSNFFGRNSNPISVDTYVLSPILEYEIPGKTRDFRISYNPVFRWYRNFNDPSHVSHFLNFDSRVEASDRLQFALRDHFARGTIESQEFDPGNELNFSSEPYIRNDVGAQVSFDVSEKNRLIGDVDFNRVVFDNRNNSTFFNFDTYSYSLGWLRDQWATANFFLRYTYTKNLTSGFNAAGRSGTSNDYDFGINKEFTDRTSGNFTLGYRTTSYDNLTGSNFRSWTARASLTKELNDRDTFDVAAVRTSSQSAFGSGLFANSFFVENGFEAQYHRAGDHIQLTLGGAYQRDSYPQFSLLTSTLPDGSIVNILGPRRLDNIYTANADVGWVLSNKMVVDFGYTFEDRLSNLGVPFSYYRHIFRISFNLGRASSGEGSQVYSGPSPSYQQQP